MKIEQKKWTAESGWSPVNSQKLAETPQLVIIFGGRSLLEDKKIYDDIRSQYPDPSTHILSCSTAGEIIDTEVHDNSLALTAVFFEKTELRFAETEVSSAADSFEAGKKLAEKLAGDNLVHVMVFSDGLKVNGTPLVMGINQRLPGNVSVTGGLVGDGTDFKKTIVGLDGINQEGKIAAIGFYGNNLRVGYGSLGGWDAFGIERTITKAENNVLYQLDDQPALALYKTYLGEQAQGLPNTGLLFPLKLHLKEKSGKDAEVVRTILAVSEKDQSMTFAGDMPVNTKVTFMKANFDRLIDGAGGASSMSIQSFGSNAPQLAILISCIGRKLVLKERIEEEVEAVKGVVGEQAAITGFYSYGELCPVATTEKQCQLHNQTMTVTVFSEV